MYNIQVRAVAALCASLCGWLDPKLISHLWTAISPTAEIPKRRHKKTQAAENNFLKW